MSRPGRSAGAPSVLALRALGLGDLLTAIPALRALGDAFPDHRHVLATTAGVADLARHGRLADEVLVVEPLAPLHWCGRRPDVAVNLHGRGPESHAVLAATAPRRLIAFGCPPHEGPEWRAGEHEVHRWCRLLAESDIPADPRRLALDPRVPPTAATPAGPPGSPLTLIHPGAGSPARRWPPARWAAVARAEARAGRRVVVTGGPEEIALAHEVAEQAGLPLASVAAGSTDVLGLAALVAGASRVFCGDTGVAHLATALARPSIVLFGPVSPKLWGPPPERPWHIALWTGCTGDPHGRQVDRGLLAIGVADVLAASARLDRYDPTMYQRPGAIMGLPGTGPAGASRLHFRGARVPCAPGPSGVTCRERWKNRPLVATRAPARPRRRMVELEESVDAGRALAELRAWKAAAEAAAVRLGVLARVTASLSKAVTERDVADVTLRAARDELRADNVSLCLLCGDELEIAYASGYPAAVIDHWRRFPLAADLPASNSVRRNEPVLIRSSEERDHRYPIFASTPVLSDDAFAVFPLGGEKPFGCLVVGFCATRSLDEADESFLEELAERCSAALVRARLYDERERAWEAAEHARARMNLLVRVSTALNRSLDYESTACTVATMMAAEAAEGCAVVVFDEGKPVAVAVRHRHPDRTEALRAAAERLVDVDEDLSDALGATAMVRPLRARGNVLGALVLVGKPGRPFDDETGMVADEVASRLASAVDNGRLFKERTIIAQTLQASLLPPELPEIPGVDLAARHVAAGSGVEVGGDFYDVFRLDARRFAIVLGDVCGRGVGAASLAALCRHTVRSAVVTTTDPAAILAHVNEVLLRQAPDAYEPRFCTAVVAVGSLEEGGVTVRLALGGHPPPALRRVDGTVERVGIPGFLLGVRADAPATDAVVRIAPGEALVCVTDGVLERRRPGAMFGDEGFAAAVQGAPPESAGLMAAAVESAVLAFTDEEAGDDLAVLVVRACPRTGGSRTPDLRGLEQDLGNALAPRGG